jgi:nucleoside 2-deoxyribosyltransferase
MHQICFLCGLGIDPFQWVVGETVSCPRCGRYIIDESVIRELHEHARVHHGNRHIYSGACRELFESGISPVIVNDLEVLLSAVRVPTTLSARLDRLLTAIANNSSTLDGGVAVTDSWYPIAYLKSRSEMAWLLRHARKAGFIEEGGTLGGHNTLSMHGWERVEEAAKRQPDSTMAFVAMSFNPRLFEIYEKGIAPALRAVGYDPQRVDTTETNGKIDDKIMADIRKSALVVADFTGQKRGVYFEAGFALGLGTPVIFTCKERQERGLHFDTRQYSHIVWTNLEELRKKLVNRIEGTIPNYPRRRQ